MSGNSTRIMNPSDVQGEPRKFTFDYSYWSHDGFEEDSEGYLYPVQPTYADQKKVFQDLGDGVLENAWKGYNCSLFAYGQTGSGKSYSMVGYGANKGIVPVTCEKLFKGIEEKEGKGEEFQVSFSMLEIYNEQTRDLLNLTSAQKGGLGLKVRESQSKGFYVEGLLSVAVKNFAEIEKRIAQGTKNRTVASTNMNATSSRAHTIVAITFRQKTKKGDGQMVQRSSVINLVDLAGSERAESTGATGARLKEGAAINKSLSTLGNVIKALADQSSEKKTVVPYRDSVLTKMLKNALGGNSKTVMIAALSPADINYEETLSTLRFADRAKAIKTRATVNESLTDKLIRELREENARLLAMLQGTDSSALGAMLPASAAQGMSEEELARKRSEMEEELAKNLERNQLEMEELQKSWQQRLSESEQAWEERDREERRRQERRKTTPHLWNLNEDPLLTNSVIHLLPPGTWLIGNDKSKRKPDIVLNGLSVLPDHAEVTNDGSHTVSLRTLDGSKILLNGRTLEGEDPEVLRHNDRILLGSCHLYVFHHPYELTKLAREGKSPKPVTYDLAQEEIAEEKGFDMSTKGKSLEDILLQDDLVTVMPMVNEVNAIAEALDRPIVFTIILISPQNLGQGLGKTEVKVQMRDVKSDHSWVLPAGQFVDMRYKMQEMYHNFAQGLDWKVPEAEDPLFLPSDSDTHIGSVHLFLQSALHKIEMEERLPITNYRGAEVGHMTVEVLPCNLDGSSLDLSDDAFVEDPEELMGQELSFILKIVEVQGLPGKFNKNLHCRYKFYLDPEDYRTTSASGRKAVFNYQRTMTVNPVTKQFVEHLQEQPLVIELWGQQSEDADYSDAFDQVQAPAKPEGTWITRKLKTSPGIGSKPSGQNSSPSVVEECSSCLRFREEQKKSKKQIDKLEEKMRRLKELLERASASGQDTVPVDDIKRVLSNQTAKHFKLSGSKPRPRSSLSARASARTGKGSDHVAQAAVTKETEDLKVQSQACTVM